MSRHTSRKSRWTQVNAKEYRAAFGVVVYRAGAWEGTVYFERRQEPSEGELVSWQPGRATTVRFKRPRNAMMAVEDKARELCRKGSEEIRIAFEE